MGRFIRIINDEAYIEDLKTNGLYKFIDKKILIAMRGLIKPRIICSYRSIKTDKEKGVGLGVCLNLDKISKDEYKLKLIDIINKLKQEGENEDLEYLIDDSLKLELKELKNLADKCGVKIPKGKVLFLSKTLDLMKKICKIRGEEICEKEVFIISEDGETTENLVIDLAHSTKFISLYSEDKAFTQRIENNTLAETGLPLHITSDANKCLNNFDFIINLKEDVDISILNKVNRKIIIDLSIGKCLSRCKKRSRTNNILIDDLFFENDKEIYSSESKHTFDSFLDTSLSSLFENTNTEIKRVRVGEKVVKLNSDLLNKKRQEQVSCLKKTPKCL